MASMEGDGGVVVVEKGNLYRVEIKSKRERKGDSRV